MRVNRTYSLAYSTITELNDKISAKHRSQFVDKAIKSRLNGGEDIDVSQLSSKRLLAILIERQDVSEFVIKVCKQELMS